MTARSTSAGAATTRCARPMACSRTSSRSTSSGTTRSRPTAAPPAARSCGGSTSPSRSTRAISSGWTVMPTSPSSGRANMIPGKSFTGAMSRTSERTRRRAAFQGEQGAFSELAARHYFGKSAWEPVPFRTFEEVFTAVAKGRAEVGIVPIENSLFGSIHQNYDLLRRFSLSITGEIVLRVVHALLANPGVALKDVRHIYSHPQALGQCERFLRSLRGVEAAAEYDTAGAAKMIRDQGRTDAAAIASREAARLYGLRILRSGIETDHRNFTRFIVL